MKTLFTIFAAVACVAAVPAMAESNDFSSGQPQASLPVPGMGHGGGGHEGHGGGFGHEGHGGGFEHGGGFGHGGGFDHDRGFGRSRGSDYDRGYGRGFGFGWRRGPGWGYGENVEQVACYARNARGITFQAIGYNSDETQERALQGCMARSYVPGTCRELGCR